VIATAHAGLRLSVVKISTDQPGLYGFGCATFTQRAEQVKAAVEKYLRPFLIASAPTASKTSGSPATTTPIGATGPC
jgi:mannonate dehydratase